MDLAAFLSDTVAAAGREARDTAPTARFPAFPVSRKDSGNSQHIDIKGFSLDSRISREFGGGTEKFRTVDQIDRRFDRPGARARESYVEARETRELREKPAGSTASISRYPLRKREMEGENGKSRPLPAVSSAAEPGSTLATWRAGLARLHPDYAPCGGYRHGDWPRVLADALLFLDEHGEWAEKLGWSTSELFGVHPEAGAVRVDACGALALGTGRVQWLTHSAVTYENGLTYRRKPGQPQGTPLWAMTYPPF